MSRQVIEWARIRLAPGKTETDLLEGSNRFQEEFLQRTPGFVSRDLVRLDNGEFADVVRWESMDAAAAAMQQAATSAACHRYFSVMAINAEDPGEGVAHFGVIASYCRFSGAMDPAFSEAFPPGVRRVTGCF